MTDQHRPIDQDALHERLERHLGQQALTATLRRTALHEIERRADRRRGRRRGGAAFGGLSLALAATVTVLVVDDAPTVLRPADTEVTASIPRPTLVDDPSPTTSDTAVSEPEPEPDPDPEPEPDRTVEYRWEVEPEGTIDGFGAVVPGSNGSGVANIRLSNDPSVRALFVTDDARRWVRIDLEPGMTPLGASGRVDDLRAVVLDQTGEQGRVLAGRFRDGTWTFEPVTIDAGETHGGASFTALGDVMVLGVWIDDSWRAFRVEPDESTDGLEVQEVTAATGIGGRAPDGPTPILSSGEGVLVLASPVVSSEGVLGADGALTSSDVWGRWELRTSIDGTTWTPAGEAPFAACCPVRWRGSWVAVDHDTGELQVSATGDSWTPLPLPSTEDQRPWVATSDAVVATDQVVTVIASRAAAPVRLSISENGVTMVFDQTMQVLEVFDDATGELIGSSATDTADDLVELDTDAPPTLRVFATDGSVRAEFTVEEAAAAVAATPETAPDVAILQSSDLATWTVTDLTPIVGGTTVYAELIARVDGTLAYQVIDRDQTTRTIIGTPT